MYYGGTIQEQKKNGQETKKRKNKKNEKKPQKNKNGIIT